MSGGWQDRADELHERGGVPPVRSRVVALREQGQTYDQIVDELGLSSRGAVSNHVSAYERQCEQAAWLRERGPAAEEL